MHNEHSTHTNPSTALASPASSSSLPALSSASHPAGSPRAAAAAAAAAVSGPGSGPALGSSSASACLPSANIRHAQHVMDLSGASSSSFSREASLSSAAAVGSPRAGRMGLGRLRLQLLSWKANLRVVPPAAIENSADASAAEEPHVHLYSLAGQAAGVGDSTRRMEKHWLL
eukprot:GHVT01022089.1.p1 GENE.GHVT01022089.1~~GHVT01022089.1.p1  ORF type:complete len:172 (+),score=46.58 GHVT01022089.1:338-853(+)